MNLREASKKMVDYTGRLNKHEDYIKILNALELKSKYIEIVLIDEKKTNDLIESFRDSIILTKIVSKWWGTETRAKNKLIRLEASKELFKYLAQFETFCKYYVFHDKGDYSEITNFGVDDIAFYDKKDIPLLYTTTHEGYILIQEDLI